MGEAIWVQLLSILRVLALDGHSCPLRLRQCLHSVREQGDPQGWDWRQGRHWGDLHGIPSAQLPPAGEV